MSGLLNREVERRAVHASSGEKAVAVAASSIALLPLPGIPVFTGSIIAVVLLFPILISFVRYQRLLLGLLTLATAVLVISPISAALAGATGPEMPQWDWLIRTLSLVFSAIVIFWSSQRIGLVGAVLLAIPAPLLFDLVTRAGQGNDWKYAISVWVTVGLLVAVHQLKMSWKLLAVAVIVLISALNDTRGIIAMVAAGAIVELLARTGRAKMYRIAASCVGCLALATTSFQLSLVGAFGSHIQSTMLQQTERGPMSLLRTARPESEGNVSLVASEPLRFVIDHNVTAEQAAIIRNSFAQVDRDPNSTYVDSGILQGAELHSVIADFWLHLGTVGLIVVLVFGAIFVAIGGQALRSSASLTCLAIFISLRGIWDLLFSPVSDLRFWPLYIVVGLSFVSFEKGFSGKAS